jgi:hypothetical protein
MSLFKKVEDTKIGAKVLVYGEAGVGKTLFGLSFPRVIAIDSEDGMAFYKKNPNLKYILQTTSAVDVEDGLDEILDMDDIDTLVIDSETNVYENLQHSALAVAERRARIKGQDIDGIGMSVREWGKIKLITKRIQLIKIELASKGINVVSVAQEKPIKQKKGDEWVTIGYTPDAAKGLEYNYDIVLRAFTKKEGDDEKYFMEVKKDRTQKYKKGTIIENASFDSWKDVFDNKKNLKEEIIKYRDDIIKDIVANESEAELSEELVIEFKNLFKNATASNKTKIKDKVAELGFDLKAIKNEEPKKIKQLVDYIKSL